MANAVEPLWKSRFAPGQRATIICMHISEKVAWVTGGASGLGAATVRTLASCGARVVILDQNAEASALIAREFAERVRFVSTDLSKPSTAEAGVRMALEAFGRVEILVNCAGIAAVGRILGKHGLMPLEEFTRVIDVNLTGTFNVIRLALPHMAQNEPSETGERGVIVNTASIAAFDGQIGQAAYAASKAAIAGLTLPLAREFARHAIRVMAIAPGPFETPLMASLPREAQESLGAAIPYPPRLGNPGEFAALVRHIIENTYLNGEVIRLDGALRMGPK